MIDIHNDHDDNVNAGDDGGDNDEDHSNDMS